jgi:hypothetical protein
MVVLQIYTFHLSATLAAETANTLMQSYQYSFLANDSLWNIPAYVVKPMDFILNDGTWVKIRKKCTLFQGTNTKEKIPYTITWNT